jgi:hypothetical protein
MEIWYLLNPEVFIEAGTDPHNVEGWEYAQVDGEWKFIKYFNFRTRL